MRIIDFNGHQWIESLKYIKNPTCRSQLAFLVDEIWSSQHQRLTLCNFTKGAIRLVASQWHRDRPAFLRSLVSSNTVSPFRRVGSLCRLQSSLLGSINLSHTHTQTHSTWCITWINPACSQLIEKHTSKQFCGWFQVPSNFWWTIQWCWGFWLISSTSTQSFPIFSLSKNHIVGGTCVSGREVANVNIPNSPKPSASQLRFWPEEALHWPWGGLAQWNHPPKFPFKVADFSPFSLPIHKPYVKIMMNIWMIIYR